MFTSAYWAWFTFGRGLVALWIYLVWHHSHWSVAAFITLTLIRMELEDYSNIYKKYQSKKLLEEMTKDLH